MKQAKTKRPQNIVAEIAGWYGMSAIVGAYGLVSFGVIEAEGVIYQLLNLSGALGVLWVSAVKHVGQVVALNVFWAGIAIAALVGILF